MKKSILFLLVCTATSFAMDSDSESLSDCRPNPLYHAVWKKPAVMEKLLAKGQDPNERGELGTRPLETAASHGNRSHIRLLLDSGADPSLEWDSTGDLPLHVALEARKKHNAALLIMAAKGDLNQLNRMNKKKQTPLNIAQKKKMWGVVELLIEAGVDVSSEDRAKLIEIIQKEKQRKKERDQKRREGILLTLQEEDESSESDSDVESDDCSMLPLIERPTRHGWSLLHGAMHHPNPEKAKELLGDGANPNNRWSSDGETPLHFAARSDSATDKHVELLLKHGAHTTYRTRKKKELPIHIAVQNGKYRVVALLAAHAKTHDELIAPRKDGKTPLDLAVEAEHWKTALALVKAGVDVSEKDRRFIERRAGVPGVYVDLKGATKETPEAPVKSIEPLKSKPHRKKHKHTNRKNPVLEMLKSGALSIATGDPKLFEALYQDKKAKPILLQLAAANAKYECPACFDTISNEDNFAIASMKCMHFICKKCKAEWRKQRGQEGAKSCPVCVQK